MGKKLDLAGTETPYFKVLSPAPNKGRHTRWNCICKRCGKPCVKSTYILRGLKVQSCGCLAKERLREKNQKNIKDLSGKRFGKLVVKEYAGYSIKGHAAWRCVCDCGRELITDNGSLRAGYRTSCGCSRTSLGAQRIENVLKENNISYKKEFTFSDLRNLNSRPLYFDFAVFNKQNDLVKLIEYDGEQHFSNKGDNSFFTDNLEARQKNDACKNNYCKDNNIVLLRVPFTLKNKITLGLLFSEEERKELL